MARSLLVLLSGQEKKGIPVIAIVGDVGAGAEKMYDHGIDAIFSINRVAVPFSEAKKTLQTGSGSCQRGSGPPAQVGTA